ncbi:glycosyltransferase family 2 protein [Raoultella sp. BAC10a-01-01]|uniref:Glycosyltransferase family 2 protein n=1 Tax=Raoultella scottii TaxID=3040937 RepID=A0ABU8Z5D5_9ENTR
MNEYVSIVIPTFNSTSYIEETILSITSFYPEEYLDVIIVDDCSDDISTLKALESKYRCLTIIEKNFKTNAADSRNIGIRNAKHNNVFLLDSDDLYTEGYIEHRVLLMNETKCAIYFGAFYEVDKQGKSKLVRQEYNGGDIREYIFVNKGDFRTSTISINKKLFNSTFFDEKQYKHQDWGFGIRVYDNEENIYYDKSPFVRVCSGRHKQMSSQMNIPASKYFLENYLLDSKYRLHFIRLHYVNALIQKDKEALVFFDKLLDNCSLNVKDRFRYFILGVLHSKILFPFTPAFISMLKNKLQ